MNNIGYKYSETPPKWTPFRTRQNVWL